ncbi:MAG: DUF58 domain-containing protein [Clostridia bacterium]
MIVFFAFLAVLVIYFAICKLYDKYWEHNLSVEIFLPDDELYEGEKSSVVEVIVNDKFLPLPTLETRFYLDRRLRYIGDTKNSALSDMMYRRDAFTVGIKQKISRSFDIICTKRGYYTLDTLDLISSDLFLNKKFIGKRNFFKYFYVFPRKVESSKIAIPYRQICGELTVKKLLYEDPFSFAGIRDYTPTDTLNSINWKASAKSQNLVVNTYESSIKQKVFVLLDTFNNENMDYENLNEESIRISCAMMERLLMQGSEVTIVSNSVDALSQKTLLLQDLNGIPINVLKQHLSRIKLGLETPLDTYISQIPHDSFVIVISKNTNLEQKLSAHFSSFYWIVPYKDEIPKFSLSRDKFYLWRLESAIIFDDLGVF